MSHFVQYRDKVAFFVALPGFSLSPAGSLLCNSFARPADPEGLAWWNDVLEGISDDDEVGFAERFALIREDFAGEGGETSEFDEVVEGLSNEELVDQIYQNLFGRGAGEDDNRDFWVDQLDDGESTPVSIVSDIVAGVEEDSVDALTLANRIAAANYFTGAMSGKTYERADIPEVREVLFSVTDDEDSVGAAQGSYDDWIAEQPDQPEPDVPGEAYVLTVGQDTETGTSNNDTFIANVVQNDLGYQTNTLATGDILDGAGGYNVLDAKVAEGVLLGGTQGMAIQPTTQNIQELNFEALNSWAAQGGNNSTVYINARDMVDVETIASSYSDAKPGHSESHHPDKRRRRAQHGRNNRCHGSYGGR